MECIFCSHWCRSKCILEQHYQSHVQEHPYFCPKCPTELTTKSNLYKHLQIHKPITERELLSCPVCKKQFLSLDRLKVHKKFFHDGLRKFECKICKKKVQTISSLKRHQVVHKKNWKPFVCKICHKGYNLKGNLKRHEYVHYEKRHKCQICGGKFSEKSTLVSHMRTHSSKRERFQCDKCSKSFLTKLCYKEHSIIHQEQEYSFQCDKCKQHFLTSRKLKIHKASTHLEKSRIFICVFCGKTFPNFSTLQRHLNPNHIHERPYLCKRCPAEFCEQNGLRSHSSTHNKSRKQFQCNMCPKSFLTKHGLHNHIRQHVGELHYKCQEAGCGMLFASYDHRRHHFLKVHVGKKFSCTICEKKFLRNKELKQHAAAHSNCREYRCDQCGRSFNLKGYLNSHMRTVHNFKLNITTT